MNTISELINWCRESGRNAISVAEMEDIITHNINYEKPQTVGYSENLDEKTQQALDLLCEVMGTHKRTYSKLEEQLIETGVMSGRCFVSWHENKYYPGATVDELRTIGFDAFYEKYKSNWEKIKAFRKQFIKEKYIDDGPETDDYSNEDAGDRE